MIDKASGFQAEAITKWADWVTVNLWGTEYNKQINSDKGSRAD